MIFKIIKLIKFKIIKLMIFKIIKLMIFKIIKLMKFKIIKLKDLIKAIMLKQLAQITKIEQNLRMSLTILKNNQKHLKPSKLNIDY